MQFKFYGGAQEVGRSAIMLKDEKSFLFDFGVKIEDKQQYPIGIPKVDALLLSHGHLDHCGFTPALYKEDTIPTFGTPPTLRIANLLLDDSLNIAKKEHLHPPFQKAQIKALINHYVPLDYHHIVHFGNYEIELYNAGHICGSAITLLERRNAAKYKRIVYTGDLKLRPQTLHKGAEVVESDILITESTYANKNHPDRNKTLADFIANVERVLDSGGNVLLPAFAVGRSQELLAVLHHNELSASTYIDGMAKEATSIAMNYPKYFDNYDALSKGVSEVNWIRDRNERREALNAPSIILTTSGMLNGGPVLDYISRLSKNSEIFLTGFQQEGTNGRLLMDKGYINMDGAKKRITNPVKFFDFSAHSGMDDLHEYVKRSSPSVVICVHGDAENAVNLAESLKLEGFDAYAPKVGDTIKLDEN